MKTEPKRGLKKSGQFLGLLFVFRGKVLIIQTPLARLFWDQKTEIAVLIHLMRRSGLEALLRIHPDILPCENVPRDDGNGHRQGLDNRIVQHPVGIGCFSRLKPYQKAKGTLPKNSIDKL
jgi:hypothetical protein